METNQNNNHGDSNSAKNLKTDVTKGSSTYKSKKGTSKKPDTKSNSNLYKPRIHNWENAGIKNRKSDRKSKSL